MEKSELFDRSAVMFSVDAIGAEAMRKILEVFVKASAEESAQIALQHEAGDIDEVRRLAHGLGGAAGNCSAIRVQELARTIEHSGSPDRKQVEALRSAVDQSAIWVRDELPKLL